MAVLLLYTAAADLLRRRQARSPRIRRASCMSLGVMVTRLAWIAARLVSSNRPTRYASLALWSARIACDWNLRSVLKSCATSRTRRWNGRFRHRSSVPFWYLRISRSATVPGLHGHGRQGFSAHIHAHTTTPAGFTCSDAASSRLPSRASPCGRPWWPAPCAVLCLRWICARFALCVPCGGGDARSVWVGVLRRLFFFFFCANFLKLHDPL